MKKILLLVLLAMFVVNFTAPVWAAYQGIHSSIMDGPPGDPKDGPPGDPKDGPPGDPGPPPGGGK